MTSPVLVRRFLIGWFQAPFLGKPNRSRATSQLELRTSDSTGACGLVLDNPESGGASGLEVTLEVPGGKAACGLATAMRQRVRLKDTHR